MLFAADAIEGRTSMRGVHPIVRCRYLLQKKIVGANVNRRIQLPSVHYKYEIVSSRVLASVSISLQWAFRAKRHLLRIF
jgi:hypothetical protein